MPLKVHSRSIDMHPILEATFAPYDPIKVAERVSAIANDGASRLRPLL